MICGHLSKMPRIASFLNSVTRIEMPTYPLLSYLLDVGCGNAMGVGSLPAITDARQAATGEKMRMRQ
jgi:hypothetical protein